MQRTLEHMQRTLEQWKDMLLCGLVTLLVVGCGSVMAPEIRQAVDRRLTFAQLRLHPDAYLGRLAMLGGEIIRTTNVPGATLLEVAQRPLDSQDAPRLSMPSEGRFMVRCEQYLDPLTSSAGHAITVAGRVLGTQAEKQDEIDIVYPLLNCVSLYVWPQPADVELVYPGGGYWWEWDPWYWDPWYWHHSHRYPRRYWHWRPQHRHHHRQR